MIDEETTDTINRMLSVFETGSPERNYTDLFIYRDGNGGRKQLTLSIGFTSDGKNLQKVMEAYIARGGKDSDYMKTMLKASTPQMVADKEFQKRLSCAGKEEAMKDAQDAVFLDVYLKPALKWAERYGFKLNLSVAAICDSFLHSGKMRPQLMAKFPEKKPSDGGNEKVWIKDYLKARFNWLNNSSGVLQNTIYRPKFFLNLVTAGRWDFKCPLSANGAKIC